ncbi:trace amine-associated receptor 1-like [Amia ocellicauda]|uniref:trace amine-associated receptor 1-like n=1 Tax=Amia ocellicauda TaxID=2972642 RepID=UPI003463B00B
MGAYSEEQRKRFHLDILDFECRYQGQYNENMMEDYIWGLIHEMLITVGGNLVVIISISHFKQLHSPNNLLVLSLAIADFLLGLFVIPFSMIRMVENCWYMGLFYCNLHVYIEVMFGNTSSFHLCLIAIDRYYAVCEPLRYADKINIRMWIYLDVLTFFVSCFVMIGIYARIYTVARNQARLIKIMEDRTFTLEDIYINSTFNPLIYAFFYPWFQKAVKVIVTLKIYHPNSSRTKLYAE